MSLPCSLLPKAARNVFPRIVVGVLVEPLVGRRLVQWTKVLEIRTNLDVVEVILVHLGRKAHSATIPRHLQVWVFLMDVLCQSVDSTRFGITTHEGDAGDVLAVLLDEVIDGISGERHANVLPQIRTVATRTMAWAPRYVDGKCHLIGYLLKHDVAIDVLEHDVLMHLHVRSICVQPLPDVAVRSC